MLQSVIFDWDEVIVKTDAFNRSVFQKILPVRGLLFTPALYRKHFAGRQLRDGLEAYLQDVAGPAHLLDELIAAKKSFDSEFGRLVMPHDDALGLITRLRGRYPLAIASGTRKVLCDAGMVKLGLVEAFDAVITSEQYVYGKPAPDAFLAALAMLNKFRGHTIQPKNTLVIEDHPLGVEAAKAAGMKCAAVTHTHSADALSRADIVVDDLRDIHVEEL